MKLHHLTSGPLSVNCYIIETENKNAVAIDIGGDYPKLKKILEENNLSLKKILLTHGHYDHFGGVADAVSDTQADVYIHELDAKMLENSSTSFADQIGNAPFMPVNEYNIIHDEDVITLDELSFKVLNTPGHTKGCVCYICEDSIFTGDTLFKLSMGRTDFPTGNPSEMRTSLSRLADITEDLKVYPGHNDCSTLAFEKRNNPYMKENPYEDFI